MRGIASAYQWTREATTEALRQYYKAIELDPKFAMAYALAASCYSWQKLNGWVTDPASDTAETSRLVGQATRLGQDDAQVLGWSGAPCDPKSHCLLPQVSMPARISDIPQSI